MPDRYPLAWRLLTWTFVSGQAVVLFVAGLATLWWSQDLMTWLIHIVGEERALGSENVVITQDGGRLLTNPGAMVLWTLPFLILGFVQLVAAVILFGYRTNWWTIADGDSLKE